MTLLVRLLVWTDRQTSGRVIRLLAWAARKTRR